jgi:hypothetical protein
MNSRNSADLKTCTYWTNVYDNTSCYLVHSLIISCSQAIIQPPLIEMAAPNKRNLPIENSPTNTDLDAIPEDQLDFKPAPARSHGITPTHTPTQPLVKP